MSDNIILPPARFVWGSLTDLQKTDHRGQPLEEAKQHFIVGLAIRKDDPAITGVMSELWNIANSVYGNYPAVQTFDVRPHSGFSWKIDDGDAPNAKGQLNENTQGCFVFKLRTGRDIPFRVVDQDNKALDPAVIKRGYYVDAVINAKPNGEQGDRAGLYLNPVFIRFLAYGKEIIGGISADEAFGSHKPAALPPGASATPLAGSPPSAAQPQPAMPGATAPTPAAPTASHTSAVQPAHDFVQNATGQPPAASAPTAAPMPGMPRG